MNDFNENQGMDFNPKTMKYCKQCGKAIAKNAKACPNCGGKNKKPIYKRKLFILLVALIVIGAAVSALGGDAKPDEKIEYTKYAVSELNSDLEKNAVSAKEKYDEQYVSLTGKLDVIDSNGSYISITDPDDEWDLLGVMCYIKTDKQLETIKEMSVGDIVTVKGKITDVGEIFGYYLDIDKVKKSN